MLLFKVATLMFVPVLFFPHTGFGTILPQLWWDSSNLDAEIKPWLSFPGFQFCITLSCAKGLFIFTINSVFPMFMYPGRVWIMLIYCIAKQLSPEECDSDYETHRVSACFSLHTEAISVWWAQSRLRTGGWEEDSSPAKHQNGVDRCSAVKNIIIHIV